MREKLFWVEVFGILSAIAGFSFGHSIIDKLKPSDAFGLGMLIGWMWFSRNIYDLIKKTGKDEVKK